MNTLNIEIKTRAQADSEFSEAFKAAQSGRRPPSKGGVFFTSLEAVRRLLTGRRMALLHLIRERHPGSIYELARMAGRDFKNVYADLMLLRRYGLVRFPPATRAKRARRKFSVPYEAINIHAQV